MDDILRFEDLRQHLLTVGVSGAGKSVLLGGLALRVIGQGGSVVVVDPHNTLILSILERMDPARVKDVVSIRLTETELVPGLNLLERPDPPTAVDTAASATMVYHTFSSLFGLNTAAAPRMHQVLRAIVYTLMEYGATLAEADLLLTSETARKTMCKSVTNPEILAFWTEYNSLSAREKRDLTDSTRNKLAAFLALPMVRNMVGQTESLDVGKLVDSGKILFVNLSPRFEEASVLLSEIVLTKLILCAFARAERPSASHPPVLIIIDEFHRVATGSVAILLRESRKANFALAIASQTLMSLTDENRAAALACGNLMAFRVSGLDAGVLAKSFDATPQPTPQHLVPEHPLVFATDAIALLVRDGHRDPRVTRFAQGALANFERFMHEREPFAWCRRMLDQVVLIHPTNLVTARQQLNEAFFTCMRSQNPEVYIPPLALYILIASQRCGWEQSVDQWVRKWGEYLSGFAYRSEKFEEFLLGRLAQTRAQVRWWRPLRQELAWAQGVWHIITELRYTLQVLAKAPLFATTGELELTMYPRTFADQTNQILSELVSLPNYVARARFVSSGEHVLKTRPLGPAVSEAELTRRLAQIRRQMWEQGLTRYAKDVEKEIAERHTKLRGSENSDEPPPTSF